MRIAVVGSSGGMGLFFVKYFLSRGMEVRGSDIRRTRMRSSRFKYFRANSEAVWNADATLLAVPIDRTLQTAKEILADMKRGSALIEMCSVKGKIRPRLREALEGTGVRLFSIHPLFGPSMHSTRGLKIVHVTSKNAGSDIRTLKKIFPDANLLAVRESEHDKIMALTLSLNHITNLVYAKTLAQYASPTDFRRFATPNSLIQLTLAEGVLSQDPSLYSYIQIENKHAKVVVESFLENMRAMARIIGGRDRKKFERFFRELGKTYHDDLLHHNVMEKVYEASRIIDER